VTYLGELLINPTPFFAAVAVLGFVGFSALGIGSLAWASLGVAGIVTKAALDVALTHRLRGRAPSLVAVGWLPLKDLMIAVLWAVAAVRRTVVWRGNRMWIGAGTVLSPMPSAADELDLAGLPPLEPSVEDAAGTNS
jgi:hypothetical protein